MKTLVTFFLCLGLSPISNASLWSCDPSPVGYESFAGMRSFGPREPWVKQRNMIGAIIELADRRMANYERTKPTEYRVILEYPLEIPSSLIASLRKVLIHVTTTSQNSLTVAIGRKDVDAFIRVLTKPENGATLTALLFRALVI